MAAAEPEADPPLPPLTALRAFEVAARHLSFTRAAAELCVTQTAISHQIKQLEQHIGVPLFRREPRRLALTSEGEIWARELRVVFTQLYAINRRLRARARARPVVSVSVIPSFGARWLVPRLGDFLTRHPEVDVRISPNEQLVNFALEPIDIGIRFGHGKYAGLVVEKLAGDALIVVCAPSLRSRRALATPEDLRRHVLLHDDEPQAWSRWLAAQGQRDIDAERGPVLTDSSMLVAAAIEGQGVALARRSLALDDIAAGRLVLPFPRLRPMALARAYYIAAPRENLVRPHVAAFRNWLRAQGQALRAGA
jgi:LysR family transcriptional regulator, glycine cleavage system transcriptional activator